jgi:serine/threonine protein kinase
MELKTNDWVNAVWDEYHSRDFSSHRSDTTTIISAKELIDKDVSDTISDIESTSDDPTGHHEKLWYDEEEIGRHYHNHHDNDDDDNDDESQASSDSDDRNTHEMCVNWVPGPMSQQVFQLSSLFQPERILINKGTRKLYIGTLKDSGSSVICTISSNDLLQTKGKEVYKSEFPREIKVFRSIMGGPHLLPLLHYLPLDNYRFYGFITPFIQSTDLVKSVNGNRYLVSKVMKQLLEGIAHMHERQVIHRDLCRDNVLWDPIKEELTIIDFDLAVYKKARGCYRHAGRPNYDAPEKVKAINYYESKKWNPKKPKVPGYHEKVDEYAAGVIMWMLLMISASPDSDTLRKWYRRTQRSRKDKSISELNLVMKLLSPDPANRITAVEALQHPFLTETQPDQPYQDFRTQLEEKMKMTGTTTTTTPQHIDDIDDTLNDDDDTIDDNEYILEDDDDDNSSQDDEDEEEESSHDDMEDGEEENDMYADEDDHIVDMEQCFMIHPSIIIESTSSSTSIRRIQDSSTSQQSSSAFVEEIV